MERCDRLEQSDTKIVELAWGKLSQIRPNIFPNCW